jgi:c(7)-type cytochrome triheme protein
MNSRISSQDGRGNGRVSGKAAGIFLAIMVSCLVLHSLAGSAHAVASGVTITYSGQGAGEVVFNGTVHTKTLACADCHESDPELPAALYEMKKGAEKITMNKISRGRSCGRCHEVVMTNYLICSKCHHNK